MPNSENDVNSDYVTAQKHSTAWQVLSDKMKRFAQMWKDAFCLSVWQRKSPKSGWGTERLELHVKNLYWWHCIGTNLTAFFIYVQTLRLKTRFLRCLRQCKVTGSVVKTCRQDHRAKNNDLRLRRSWVAKTFHVLNFACKFSIIRCSFY